MPRKTRRNQSTEKNDSNFECLIDGTSMEEQIRLMKQFELQKTHCLASPKVGRSGLKTRNTRNTVKDVENSLEQLDLAKKEKKEKKREEEEKYQAPVTISKVKLPSVSAQKNRRKSLKKPTSPIEMDERKDQSDKGEADISLRINQLKSPPVPSISLFSNNQTNKIESTYAFPETQNHEIFQSQFLLNKPKKKVKVAAKAIKNKSTNNKNTSKATTQKKKPEKGKQQILEKYLSPTSEKSEKSPRIIENIDQEQVEILDSDLNSTIDGNQVIKKATNKATKQINKSKKRLSQKRAHSEVSQEVTEDLSENKSNTLEIRVSKKQRESEKDTIQKNDTAPVPNKISKTPVQINFDTEIDISETLETQKSNINADIDENDINNLETQKITKQPEPEKQVPFEEMETQMVTTPIDEKEEDDDENPFPSGVANLKTQRASNSISSSKPRSSSRKVNKIIKKLEKNSEPTVIPVPANPPPNSAASTRAVTPRKENPSKHSNTIKNNNKNHINLNPQNPELSPNFNITSDNMLSKNEINQIQLSKIINDYNNIKKQQDCKISNMLDDMDRLQADFKNLTTPLMHRIEKSHDNILQQVAQQREDYLGSIMIGIEGKMDYFEKELKKVTNININGAKNCENGSKSSSSQNYISQEHSKFTQELSKIKEVIENFIKLTPSRTESLKADIFKMLCKEIKNESASINSLKEENQEIRENFEDYKAKTSLKLEQLVKQNDLLQSQLNMVMKSRSLEETLKNSNQAIGIETKSICNEISKLQKSFELQLNASPKTPICTGTTTTAASTQCQDNHENKQSPEGFMKSMGENYSQIENKEQDSFYKKMARVDRLTKLMNETEDPFNNLPSVEFKKGTGNYFSHPATESENENENGNDTLINLDSSTKTDFKKPKTSAEICQEFRERQKYSNLQIDPDEVQKIEDQVNRRSKKLNEDMEITECEGLPPKETDGNDDGQESQEVFVVEDNNNNNPELLSQRSKFRQAKNLEPAGNSKNKKSNKTAKYFDSIPSTITTAESLNTIDQSVNQNLKDKLIFKFYSKSVVKLQLQELHGHFFQVVDDPNEANLYVFDDTVIQQSEMQNNSSLNKSGTGQLTNLYFLNRFDDLFYLSVMTETLSVSMDFIEVLNDELKAGYYEFLEQELKQKMKSKKKSRQIQNKLHNKNNELFQSLESLRNLQKRFTDSELAAIKDRYLKNFHFSKTFKDICCFLKEFVIYGDQCNDQYDWTEGSYQRSVFNLEGEKSILKFKTQNDTTTNLVKDYLNSSADSDAYNKNDDDKINFSKTSATKSVIQKKGLNNFYQGISMYFFQFTLEKHWEQAVVLMGANLMNDLSECDSETIIFVPNLQRGREVKEFDDTLQCYTIKFLIDNLLFVDDKFYAFEKAPYLLYELDE